LTALLACFVSDPATAQDKTAAPRDEIGLNVGAEAPAFNLKDQDGKARTLEELLEKGPVALVFYRSADW
jgi:cytochrome oxidase Cu insertion factor (SCO1/SenC/PrrC family)